jgi:uncharacterized protein with PQ loop repeat
MNNISFPVLIGSATVIMGILVKILGFPDQFLKNYRRKSTEGLSKIFIVLTFISYCLWTLHGFYQKDSVLILGQGAGVITSGAIVIQLFIYQKRKTE